MSDSEAPPRATAEQLARYAEHFNQSPILRSFGVRVSFPDGEKVVVELPEVRPEQRGGLGTLAVNGGVLAALFDLAIGCSAALIDPTRRAATMQLSMSFERPVEGHSLWLEAVVDSAGRTTVYASARLYDETGQVCARCQGLVRLSQLPWAEGRSSPAVI